MHFISFYAGIRVRVDCVFELQSKVNKRNDLQLQSSKWRYFDTDGRNFIRSAYGIDNGQVNIFKLFILV